MTTPYTLSDHFRRAYTPNGQRVHFDAFVQVQSSGVTNCAKVRDAWVTDEGRDMWRVDLLGPLQGRSSFPVAKVIQCSGLDGHCTCAGEPCTPPNFLRSSTALTGKSSPSLTA